MQSWDTSKDGKCFCSLMDLLNSYLMVSSVVGFYSLRVFEALTPRKDDTTMTTVKMELKNRVWGEVGARVLRLPQMCWCVWDPPCFICPPFSALSSYCSLMFSSGILNGFSQSVQYLFVGCANIGKVQAPFLHIRGRVGCFEEMLGGWGWWRMCTVLSHSGTSSLVNEFGSGEAC